MSDFAVSPEAMRLCPRFPYYLRARRGRTIDPVPPANSRDLETIDFGALAKLAADVFIASRSTP